MRTIWCGIFLLCFFCVKGQTLTGLLTHAETNYPLLKAKHFDVLVSESNVSSVKNLALYNLDAAYQVNYATYHNITGMSSSEFFVPISRPPSTSNTYDAIFGSNASLLLNWDVFTFRQRGAQIDVAKETWKFEVENKENILKAGSFANATLTISRSETSFAVPFSSVVTTLEKKFVIKVEGDSTQWVDVSQGLNLSEKTEIFGALNEGDTLVLKANEEIQQHTRVFAKF